MEVGGGGQNQVLRTPLKRCYGIPDTIFYSGDI